jgi:hypothetical protein
MDNANGASGWHPYEEGRTVGQKGSEGGTIIRDDEHSYGARITLERDCLRVPYAITCGVYGLMMHTRFIADEPTAQHAYDQMQSALNTILALLPREDDPDFIEKYDSASDAMHEFVERFS